MLDHTNVISSNEREVGDAAEVGGKPGLGVGTNRNEM
jgi:hypothetical protein